ncbi:hypothetical protein AB0280_15525, partial [Pseudarthrobacter sp902506025]
MKRRGQTRAQSPVSGTPRWSRLARSRWFSGTAFGAVVAVVVTGAVLYPGFKTTEVELNDGG